MSLVLDAGALVAIDRQDRQVGAMLRIAQQQRIPVRTSPAAVAQVASLARVGDQVLTSDPGDLRHLLDTLAVEATVIPV